MVLALLFWNAASLWPLAVGLGLGVVVFVLWMYPPQVKGVGRWWQVVLPLLRVVAVVALVLSILKPTLVRPRTQEENGAVVVLVDRSASMGVSDNDLTPGDRVAIADGLGMLPEGKRKAVSPEAVRTLAQLRRSLERIGRANADLEYAKLSGQATGAREKELDRAYQQAIERAGELKGSLAEVTLDDGLKEKTKALGEQVPAASRQDWAKRVGEAVVPLEALLNKRQADADTELYGADPAMKQVCDQVVGESRLRLVERALVDEKVGLLMKLDPTVPLYGYSFADGIRPVPLRSGSQGVKRLLVEADGAQSRENGAVLGAIDELKGRSIRAVVVLSDGRMVGDTAVPGQLGISNVPVYTVAVGREKGIRDLAIAQVSMPQSAFLGETVTVRVTVRSMDMPAGDYEVRLQAAGREQAKNVHLETGATGEVEFEFKAVDPGIDRVRVSVKGSDAEVTQENNLVERPLKVMQDKVNVLLVTSQPTWDFQYVRNALMRTAWAKVSDVILDDPGSTLTLSPEYIAKQNVIGLFRVRPGSLPAQQVDALHRAVTQEGASAIVTAGSPADLEKWSQNVLLSEFLPYRAGSKAVWRTWPGDRAAFKIQPAEESARSEALRLSDDLAVSQTRWLVMPSLYHYLAIPQLKANVVRTLLVEKGSKSPVLVESRLGMGRVLFMGLDETWRWRLRVGERDQDRLWLQLVRYAAEEPYTLVGKKLSMDLDRVSARPGEAVKVRVRMGKGEGRPVVEVVKAKMEDGRGKAEEGEKVVLAEEMGEAGEMQPGRYETLLRELPVGRYEVRVRQRGSGEEALKLPLMVGYDVEQEMADVSADPATLRQIASATGGQMLPIEQIGELPSRLANVRSRTSSTIETPLWTSGYLFLVVLGCLGAEWGIRKRVGLA